MLDAGLPLLRSSRRCFRVRWYIYPPLSFAWCGTASKISRGREARGIGTREGAQFPRVVAVLEQGPRQRQGLWPDFSSRRARAPG